MKRFIIALLLTLGLAVPAFADTLSGTTCPGAGCQVSTTLGRGAITIQVVGSFSGTLVFEQSNDGGTTYLSFPVFPYNSTTSVTQTTAAGLWTGNLAGVGKVRVRATTLSSGSPAVYFNTTQASLGGGGGAVIGSLSGNAYDFFTGAGTSTQTLATGTITTSSPWKFTQTWNAGGVTFSGVEVNITNTASAIASRVFTINVGGTPVFSVSPVGQVVAAAGTGTQTVKLGGLIASSTLTTDTATQNVWQVLSISIPANTLVNDGDTLVYEVGVLGASNTNSHELQSFFALSTATCSGTSANVCDSGAQILPVVTNTASLNAEILRVTITQRSGSNQDYTRMLVGGSNTAQATGQLTFNPTAATKLVIALRNTTTNAASLAQFTASVYYYAK